MGEDKKVTTMVLKVDLKCSKCYKKVKKVLCKFPQIQDQIYDEKNDTVTIKVVCCSPEKIKKKIICKGGGSITCIEIKVPEKPKPKAEPKKESDPKQTKQPETTKPPERPQEKDKSKEPEKKKEAPPPQAPVQLPACPPPPGVCCQECSSGQPGGPCFRGCGGPPLRYQYDWYCGRLVYDSYGGGRNYYGSRCDYFSEENCSGCTIM